MKILLLIAIMPLYLAFLYLVCILIKEIKKDFTDEDLTGIKDKLPPCYGKTEVQSCFKSRDECFECMMNCLDSIEEYVDENTKGR